MNKEDKINEIMDLVTEKSSLDDNMLDTFREVLEGLSESSINKLVAGIVFSEKPFKKRKIWRLE
tara:strand:+ start:1289 stop:1480 length:192 start_codon:yes stop_codon:yes gene_type:complete